MVPLEEVLLQEEPAYLSRDIGKEYNDSGRTFFDEDAGQPTIKQRTTSAYAKEDRL